jgi:hypothetical protein
MSWEHSTKQTAHRASTGEESRKSYWWRESIDKKNGGQSLHINMVSKE